jgi:hypothetical protein
MYSRKFGIHGMISALLAFAILGVSAFVMDREYLFAAPAGVVEVGPITPVTTLDEIVVVAMR